MEPESSRTDPPTPCRWESFVPPQLEWRISLDLDGELQWDGFFHPTAASAVERVQVYLHEHLPICCHFLSYRVSDTMNLVREAHTQNAEM